MSLKRNKGTTQQNIIASEYKGKGQIANIKFNSLRMYNMNGDMFIPIEVREIKSEEDLKERMRELHYEWCSYPQANEEDKKSGWKLSYRFLEKVEKQIFQSDEAPSMEAIELILLAIEKGIDIDE